MKTGFKRLGALVHDWENATFGAQTGGVMGQRSSSSFLKKLYDFTLGRKWSGNFDRIAIGRYLRPMLMPIAAVFISFIPLAAIALFHLADSDIGVGLVFICLGISLPAFAVLIFRLMIRIKPLRY